MALISFRKRFVFQFFCKRKRRRIFSRLIRFSKAAVKYFTKQLGYKFCKTKGNSCNILLKYVNGIKKLLWRITEHHTAFIIWNFITVRICLFSCLLLFWLHITLNSETGCQIAFVLEKAGINYTYYELYFIICIFSIMLPWWEFGNVTPKT